MKNYPACRVCDFLHDVIFQAAFNAVMNLWNRKPLKLYGSRMSESILAILCHIVKGEGVIRVCRRKIFIVFLLNKYLLAHPNLSFRIFLCWQSHCVVSLSRILYPLLSTGSTQEDLSQHD